MNDCFFLMKPEFNVITEFLIHSTVVFTPDEGSLILAYRNVEICFILNDSFNNSCFYLPNFVNFRKFRHFIVFN